VCWILSYCLVRVLNYLSVRPEKFLKGIGFLDNAE